MTRGQYRWRKVPETLGQYAQRGGHYRITSAACSWIASVASLLSEHAPAQAHRLAGHVPIWMRCVSVSDSSPLTELMFAAIVVQASSLETAKRWVHNQEEHRVELRHLSGNREPVRHRIHVRWRPSSCRTSYSWHQYRWQRSVARLPGIRILLVPATAFLESLRRGENQRTIGYFKDLHKQQTRLRP